ncbi:hypothetical protein Tco_1496444, partial [Tanacetum coccineum]
YIMVTKLNANISSNTPSNTGSVLITNVVNVVSPTLNGSDQDGLHFVMKDASSSYAIKLCLMSLNKANLRKLDANVPNDADFDI